MALSATLLDQVTTYLERLHDLYRDVRGWLGVGPGTEFRESEMEVFEGPHGSYAAPVLTICRPSSLDRLAVIFKPMGCRIIAAHGRVDLVSRIGHETLNYVTVPRPQPSVHSIFPEIDRDGWIG